jgi:proteic killer suppression protein
MEIYANDKDLRAALEDQDAARRRFGAAMAKKFQLRLEALTAADSLADFWPPKSGPERCHELKGNRNGIFSVDVKQPYRLLFKPIEAAPPNDRADEQQRWRSITAIELLAIEDTHG